ncbi:MAG: hypothetical protein H7328_04605 [Bdellovibrio sp.]|nr:hypothetical protein [Bdellovibrio sp.]
MNYLLGLVFSFTLVAQAQEVKPETAPIAVASAPEILPVTLAKPPTPEFEKKIDLNGDLRYRMQAITAGTKEERRVHRLMFRVGQTIQPIQDLKITYRLLTGTAANSGSVTLGDSKAPGSPRQPIGLDLAYATFPLNDEAQIYIGKYPQLTYSPGKNQLILDRDISPEGAGLQYKTKFLDDRLLATFNLGSAWLREKYDDTLGQDLTDAFLNTAQLNLTYKLSDFQFLIGYGIFSYTSIKDDVPASFAVGATSPRGNTLDLLGNYQYQYEITQNYLEIKWIQKPFDISIFAELDQNTAAPSSLNKAAVYGLTLSYSNWSFSFMQQKIEKDAVLALYSDSDFADNQTSSRGYIAAVGYRINKAALVSFTYYKNQQAIDLIPIYYTRSHIDFTFNF